MSKKQAEESLEEQRDSIRLELERNRRILSRHLVEAKQDFPRSMTMRFLTRKTTRDMLSTLAFSSMGGRLFQSAVTGVRMATFVHRMLSTPKTPPLRVTLNIDPKQSNSETINNPR